jgi:hypothetical protein
MNKLTVKNIGAFVTVVGLGLVIANVTIPAMLCIVIGVVMMNVGG